MEQTKKSTKKSTKLGLLCQGQLPQLTPAQNDILRLLRTEGLTPKQIIIRRKCSKQSVYKLIAQLKKKGYLSPSENMVDFLQPTSQPVNQIRLHGQEFNIRILYKDQRYKKITEQSNIINIDGSTIRLYQDSLEVYANKDFYAESAQKATAKSFEFWNRFFRKLENDLKIIIIKPRYQNIKLVNAHYADTNNELAEECEKKDQRIKIYTTDDGKLWFLTDHSFTNEGETVHPQKSKTDMEKTIAPFFNDMRDNASYLPSQVKHSLDANSELLNSILQTIKQITDIQLSQTIGKRIINQKPPSYMG